MVGLPLLALTKPICDQRRQCVQRLTSARALCRYINCRPNARRQHHQVHNALAIDFLVFARHADGAVWIVTNQHRKLGGRTGMEAAFVDDFQSARDPVSHFSSTGKKRGGNGDIFAGGVLGGKNRAGQAFLTAHFGKLNEHWQISPGNHFIIATVHDGDRKV
jgi:hypothetical protein